MTPDLDFSFVYSVAQVSVWFFAYSFAGWFYEVIYSFFQHHRFVNRGFVLGPLCPIYGVGALLAVFFLRPLNNPALQLVVGFVAAGVLEYGTSWVMEKLFHARWWDYTGIPLNLNGRICVPGLAIFTLLMLAVDLLFQPALEHIVSLVPPSALVVASMLIDTLFVVDFTASVIHMNEFVEKVSGVQRRIAAFSEKAWEAVAAVSQATRSRLPDVSALTEAARESFPTFDEVRLAMKDSVAGIKEMEFDVSDSLGQLKDLKVFEDFQNQVREALGKGWSLYERKNLSDPRFRFTQYIDAFEWSKRILPFLKDSADQCEEEKDAALR